MLLLPIPIHGQGALGAMRWDTMPFVKAIVVFLTCTLCASAADLRIGIIGTDTSHVPAFAKLLNGDPSAADHIAGARVVAAYKGGSQDIEESIGRVDQFAEEIQTRYGVEIVPDIPSLLSKVDVVLLTSLDGRAPLPRARAAIAAHKPLFIDKPLAATLEDAREIARLAKAAGVPWFSSSSLRFGAIGAAMKLPGLTGAATWGPGPFEAHHPLELAWYAIHPVELLYTIMGTGCESVTRIAGKDADVIVGRWKDGRIGTVNAVRPYSDYGAVLVDRVKFFQTGQPPVPNEETLEIFAFLDAAQRSKEAGGRPVGLR